MKFLSFLLVVSLAAQAQAKAVFAHFMIGNTEYYTRDDFILEMQLAKAAHIDAFVLNIAVDEPANAKSIPTAFDAAAAVGFKLLFSFDYAGNGDWTKSTVIDMINRYKSRGEYFMRGSQPLVSTFEGVTRAGDWKDIKAQTNCYFVPSFSSIGAKRAVKTDSYMMPVSPWFFTNMPGYRKNWLWRGDSLWHDRWNLIFTLVSQNQWAGQPEYVQIISWNDFGESHYIGPLNDKAYVAFDKGRAPYNYVKGYNHDAWRMTLPFAIDTYKNGIATITDEVFIAWYRRTPANACSTGGTTGNTRQQLQAEVSPGELSQDRIFFSGVLTSNLKPRVIIAGQTIEASWTDVPYGNIGMYHGSVPSTDELEVVTGASIETTSEKGITNWNSWVGFYARRGVNKRPALSLSQQSCMKGNGRAGYDELCQFTYKYGYCPPGPCNCQKLGKAEEIKPKYIDGFPLPGSDCTYTGLCSFACNHGFCPNESCTSDKSAENKCVIPPEAEDPPETAPEPPVGGGGGGGDWEVEIPDDGSPPGEWLKIDCKNSGVVNVNDDADWRWKQVEGNQAWGDVEFSWKKNRTTSKLSFSEAISNYFNGPQNMECHVLVAQNGCRNFLQCHDTKAPAGYFILNSFVYPSNIMWNFYDSISKTKANLAAEAGTLIDIFSPNPNDDKLSLAIILDIVMLGYASVAAPFWNSVMKKTSYFRANGNNHGILKDAVNGIVAGSVTLVKDVTRADSRLTATNRLQDRLKAITDVWFESADSFSSFIFSGELNSLRRLELLIRDEAWRMSGKSIGAFVLTGNVACDEYVNKNDITRAVQDKTRVCIDGRAYFLVGATDAKKNCQQQGDIGGGICDPFQILPGFDTLDGKRWGGVTKEDLVIGAYNGFKTNGYKNGGPVGDPVSDAFLSEVQDVDVRATGVVQLPLCGANEANKNYWNHYSGGQSKNYPCS